MGAFGFMPFGIAGLVLGIIALVMVTQLKREVETLTEDIKELKEKIQKEN